MESIETTLTEFITNLFRCLLFFLNPSHQSLIVSIIHYAIFIVGTYYFFFHASPGDTSRIVIFVFFALSALSYFTINKCILTHVELRLCEKKNILQNIIATYFGHKNEGNTSSKFVLTTLSVILGGVLLADYGYIPKSLNINSNGP